MNIEYRFAEYGTPFEPAPATLVLDVGLRTVPGVIDHHHPDAEPECAASLVAKHPRLVLDHLPDPDMPELTIVTHRWPDFDAVAAIYLALRLLETRGVDAAMTALAAYSRLADSASLPKTVELAETPYAVLRALFAGATGSLEEISLWRVQEGLKFMRHLAGRAEAGESLLEGPGLFRGIERYERAVRRCREDYLSYLEDVERGRKERLRLPAAASGEVRHEVDALFVRGPTSFLLKEWARRDRENAPLGRGFSFLMTGFGHRRIILGVDPESGVHLRGLAPLLDAREAERRAEEGRPMVSWYPGDAPLFGGRIIDSPRDGTSLTFDEVQAEALAFGA